VEGLARTAGVASAGVKGKVPARPLGIGRQTSAKSGG